MPAKARGSHQEFFGETPAGRYYALLGLGVNDGELKLKLIEQGVRPGSDLPDKLANPFGMVQLTLQEGLAVSVQFREESRCVLTCEEDAFFLECHDDRIPVVWEPPLEAYEQRTSSGIKVSDILAVHENFIAIHPNHECRFGLAGLSCRYCGSTREPALHPDFTVRDAIEAIQIVQAEKRCDVVNLSSGACGKGDGGVQRLEPWVEEIRKHVEILISIDVAPPKNHEWIDRAYALGVDAVYYDLEIYNPDDARLQQSFEEQHDQQLNALSYASKIFPPGAVLSHLVIGLEPLAATLKGIDHLIKRRVVPILVYFPPHGADAGRYGQLEAGEIQHLYAHLFERLVQERIPPNWVLQSNVVLTPLEGRFFSELSPKYLQAERFFRTALGRKIRMGMANIRRRLRVREVY